MILLRLLCLVAALAVLVSSAVVFEDCGSAYDLEEVNIEGCGMRLPCYVTLGENIPVNVKFYADFVSMKLDQDVVININFLNLRTSVTPEPCDTVDCPVRTDAATSFTSVMSVPTNIAMNQRGYLRWRVYNENGRLVLCYAVLVQTQSPLQRSLRQALAEADHDAAASTLGEAASLDNLEVNATSVQYQEDIVTR